MKIPATDGLHRRSSSRRDFLWAMTGIAAAALASPALAQARSETGIQLGLDTYSIRGLKWKAPRILEYAAKLKLDAVMLSPATFEAKDDAYFKQLGEQARSYGVKIEPAYSSFCQQSGSWKESQGNPVQYLTDCIRQTKLLGARTFRTLMGNSGDRENLLPIESMMEEAITSLRSVRSQAVDVGVRIAVENHGDLQARQMKTLIEEAGKDFVGSCFDAGNPVRMLEDPLMAFEILAPYIFSSHMRDSVVYEHPRGAAYQWVALGDGMIDLKQLALRYAEVCPEAVFFLEIITGRPPEVLPYFEPDFWKKLPSLQAPDFARFQALVRKGQPFMGNMIIADGGKQPPEYQAALLEQQRIDSERSLEYAKKSLGIGLRWRA